MNSPRFDGFYHDGRYFEAAWDDTSVVWPCHAGCDGKLEIPMARLWQQKLGALNLTCPACQASWQMNIASLSQPVRGDITEVSDQPTSSTFFPTNLSFSHPPSSR